MKRRYSGAPIFLAILTIMMTILLAGCVNRKPDARKTIIGAVLKYDLSPYFREVEAGLREKAAKNNTKIIILAPEERSAKKQSKLIHDLMEMNVDALILAPENEQECIPEIAEANRRKMPVILIDTGLDEKAAKRSGARASTIIVNDNEKGGRLVADYLAGKIKGKATIAMIEGKPGSFTGERRKKGFMEEMARNPRIKVVLAPPAGFDRQKSYIVCADLLKKYPDVGGIFALNDVMALGAADAINAGKHKNIRIVGCGATIDGLNAVKEGRIDATVNQFPGEMGKQAFDSAMKSLRGEPLPPEILLKPELITHETVQLPFQ